VLTATAAVGAITVSFALALPATAQITKTPGNSIIVGSGSNTTYFMMEQMDVLFNEALGCYLYTTPPATQAEDESCQPTPPAYPIGSPSYSNNPLNDVSLQEPPIGSSAGISQLTDQGSSTTKTIAVNFARSSRALKTTDQKGLTFVGYAKDGLDWIHFTSVGGKATPSANVKNLTFSQIVGIWNGTINNWDQVGGANAPLNVYSAQPSSGTYSTWKSYLGFAPDAFINNQTKYHGFANYAKTHVIIENETYQITQNRDQANAIFFYSWGKYQQTCAIGNSVCIPPKSNDKVALPEINGIAPTLQDILCQPTCAKAWPDPRYLYNVYSDGSSKSIPEATPATLNYVSEVGFICKSENYVTTAAGVKTTHETLDPNSGLAYRTPGTVASDGVPGGEISAIINAAGFIPLPLQTAEDVGSVPFPAATLLKNYAAAKNAAAKIYLQADPYYFGTGAGKNPNPGAVDPSGYCLVYNTDGNST